MTAADVAYPIVVVLVLAVLGYVLYQVAMDTVNEAVGA